MDEAPQQAFHHSRSRHANGNTMFSTSPPPGDQPPCGLPAPSLATAQAAPPDHAPVNHAPVDHAQVDHALAGHPLAGRLAAPSFVIPAGVAENARFLAGRIDEVGLCLFESRTCQAYDSGDLPPDLASLPLRWHVHLPVDLPWPQARSARKAHPARKAASTAAAVVARLMTLVPGLVPRVAVLHPPQGPPALQRALLADFAKHWHHGTDEAHAPPALRRIPLLLENVAHSDVACLGQDFLHDHGLGLCLDVGHLLGYAQETLLHSALPSQAAMLHWSAPGNGDQHLPLTALTPAQRHIARCIMADAPCTATHLVEVFKWEGLAASLPVLAALAADQKADASRG